jgi:uncharacterized protein YjbI with pentapeptide repeats
MRQDMTSTPPEKILQTQLDDVLRKHRFFSIGKPGGARAVLKFKDLSALDFRGIDLSGADFTGSDMSKSNLSRCTFNGSVFYGCNLADANLQYAKFPRADMRGANLEGAKLEGADLTTADLRAGNVVSAKKEQATPTSPVPEKVIDYSDKTETRAAFTNLDKKDEDTSYASDLDLSKKEEQNQDRKSDLSLTGETENSQAASTLDLSQILDTSATRTSDLNLGANKEASLDTGLDLSQTDAPLRVSDISLEIAHDHRIDKLRNHAKWITTGGKQGAQLDICGEDMRGVEDISQYPLTAIKAIGANFSGMNLAKAHLQSAILEGADFTETNLSQADLRGANLRNAKLIRANLIKTNLDPLTFGNRQKTVDLEGADLTDAIRDEQARD